MRRLTALLVVVLLAAATAVATAPTAPARSELELAGRLSRALAASRVGAARTGAVAVDLANGTIVFSHNPTAPFAPASTEKLAVSLALLTVLGPTHTIETRVLASGAADTGTWDGDLFLEGFGDPTLSTADLRRLATRVRAQGIERVTGSVVGDETAFDSRRTAPGWRPWYYINESPPLSALVVDRARYRGRTSRAPALAAAAIFRRALVEEGVTVRGRAVVGDAPADAVPLATTRSAPLLRILRMVNGESDNFTAEMLLKHLGVTEGGGGTTAAGSAVVKRALASAGVPLAGVRLADGSGLSLLNRLTADALVSILVAAWDDPVLRGSFLSSLAVSGRSGTLKSRLRRGPAAGRVFAKTGTTARASTLAGYVAGRYAFVVLHNGPGLSRWWSRLAQDRFVTVLARS